MNVSLTYLSQKSNFCNNTPNKLRQIALKILRHLALKVTHKETNMALIGYARVSSVGQSLDVQIDKLKHCNKVFQEKKSGASNKRPKLKACLEYVREEDTLVVTRLDRLARSTLHLCQIAIVQKTPCCFD